MQASYSLKDMLQNFLARKPNLKYPEVELYIVERNPLQVVDCELYKVELNLLKDAVLEKLSKMKGSEYREYKLILENWRFDFKKIPNSNEYYFDIQAFQWR